jgi:hypothetical protein
MAKRFITTLPDGRLAITQIVYDPDGTALAKTMFEQSRNIHMELVDGILVKMHDDPNEHFDASIHTLAAIAAGIPGHFQLACREVQDTDLPSDRYFRNAWEWSD